MRIATWFQLGNVELMLTLSVRFFFLGLVVCKLVKVTNIGSYKMCIHANSWAESSTHKNETHLRRIHEEEKIITSHLKCWHTNQLKCFYWSVFEQCLWLYSHIGRALTWNKAPDFFVICLANIVQKRPFQRNGWLINITVGYNYKL